jgi:ribose-phosphate pyrophosphokinase
MTASTDQRFVSVDECQAMINKAVSDALLKIARAPRPFKVFGLQGTNEYSAKVATHLGLKLTPHTEKNFEDGECYVKSGPEFSDSSVGNVRGHNVFVIQSLYSDETESVADKFVKLCIFCGSLKDASAHEVIPIIPHLAWARQDRKTESRAPITTKYIARMLESMKIERCLLFDVHNLAAEQNAFNVPIDVLEAKNLFADWCAHRLIADGHAKKVKVMTPDSGGLGRAERFRNALLKLLNSLGAKLDDIEVVVFDKLRIKGEVRGGRIVGDVEDADVIAYDDMISTAKTMKKACKAVVESKGRVYAICATHGLFCGEANGILDDLDTKIVISDTIRPWRLNDGNRRKLHIVDTTKMVAEAIMRIHSGSGSISELLRG